MNNLTVFSNPDFGSIRTVTINNKPYFCACDVARALGYSNANDAVTRHCRAIVKHDTPISEIRTKHKTTKQEGKQNEDGKKRYQRTHGTR